MSKATNKKVGNQIRKFRHKLGISQEELGLQAGIHRTYIGAIERGEHGITIELLSKIAKSLKVDIKDLL